MQDLCGKDRVAARQEVRAFLRSGKGLDEIPDALLEQFDRGDVIIPALPGYSTQETVVTVINGKKQAIQRLVDPRPLWMRASSTDQPIANSHWIRR